MKQISLNSAISKAEVVFSVREQLELRGAVSVIGVKPQKSELLKFLENFGDIYNQYGNTTVWDVTLKVEGADTSIGNEEIALHTEMNEFRIPPDLVALYCVRNSQSGGKLRLVDGWDLIRFFSSEEIGNLQHSILKFKAKDSIKSDYGAIENSAAVLSIDSQGNPCIRYSRNADVLCNQELVYRFAERLESLEEILYRQLEQHELLIWDNSRILHGRSRFDGSERLLWRTCLNCLNEAGSKSFSK